ncbi:MAG: phosphoadenylyl-sulfate reductase [Bacteroidota bacterium]
MHSPNIKTLCEAYSQANHRERLVKVFRDFDRVLVTSSFGTTSVIFLHMLHRANPECSVHFVDTGYLFEETYEYIETLRNRLDLNIVTVTPDAHAHALTQREKTWLKNPDHCCFLNKVEPVRRLTQRHQVWVSGMLGSGNEFRQNLPLFRKDKNILRFYPLQDMTSEDAHYYRIAHDLPVHPLELRGYGSVGCEQCTLKGTGRSGRWAGQNKTECGLHIVRK